LVSAVLVRKDSKLEGQGEVQELALAAKLLQLMKAKYFQED
jgi:hypothetical protein